MSTEDLPASLVQAETVFADEDRAREFLVNKGCRKQFTAKIGTLFADSPAAFQVTSFGYSLPARTSRA